ncbi:MAG: hypothetical protein A3H97_09630 [Acidobacteria bacterium RIFCSPLOWO2_02_FULL_65_29]|nr:MAG: hypothetical protein A3H97_09630 [Acidobacteria bacterium RIFCSPLOWO2_02_FULL_65_29]
MLTAEDAEDETGNALGVLGSAGSVIRRLLIANRGEIAVRIIRACRELGIESVAVYSEPDARAMHVSAADRAVPIGPSAAADSYLSSRRIIDAARSTLADAVHPGYGFLAQNASFAAACDREGLIFVGPNARTIADMGSKIESRRIMQQAGVPVVAGDTPVDQTDEGISAAIDRVGLPALVKASAGGGGKGMRTVRERSEVAAEVPAARREALAAFGDGTLYVERLIERPRHVEVQVFGDRHGSVVHLFERECSTQRRHQKVIEESPSPSISPHLRAAVTDAAVRAARAVSYQSAGTVEFLVAPADGDDTRPPFYFLEMNTRLQVEHGVSEVVTGVDLVRAQLLVASGEQVPWRQETLTQRGHAIEARIYAEDPASGFLPQAGRLLLYREPRMPGVRVDSGVAEGDEVSIHYDPLLAKVIAGAETRDLAMARLASALRAFPVLGVRTNIPFLLRVIEHSAFRAGMVDTGFLDREGATLLEEPGPAPAFVAAAMAAHSAHERNSTHRAGTHSRVRDDPWDGS